MMAEIFHSLDAARERFGPCAVTIGNFDGVHIGHQALLEQTATYASAGGPRAWRSDIRSASGGNRRAGARAADDFARWRNAYGYSNEAARSGSWCCLFTKEVAALTPEGSFQESWLRACR